MAHILHQLCILILVWIFNPFQAAIMIDTFHQLVKGAKSKPSVISVSLSVVFHGFHPKSQPEQFFIVLKNSSNNNCLGMTTLMALKCILQDLLRMAEWQRQSLVEGSPSNHESVQAIDEVKSK